MRRSNCERSNGFRPSWNDAVDAQAQDRIGAHRAWAGAIVQIILHARFLYFEIAMLHGLPNVPDDPDLAIAAGRKLCEELLEPLQDAFGRIAIRSAFRSAEVNGFGNRMQNEGKPGYTCASNEENYGSHIWDMRDKNGQTGATACIVVPSFWNRFQAEGDWQKLAWHLPYLSLYFFPKYWAFNIRWSERPERQIDSYCSPKGV